MKSEEEALYANKSRENSKQHTTGGSKRNDDNSKSHQGERSACSRGKDHVNSKKFEGKWYNCGKKTWQKFVGPRRSLWKATLLPPT